MNMRLNFREKLTIFSKQKDNMENINFILPTDWMFNEPIDIEHKKYVLMSYFQKIDKLIDENKIYPHFIELSLHMANLHTLIKESTILYTNKVFKSSDDELLLKELLVKPVPNLTEEQTEEMREILKFSSLKFFEYFQIVKSYWSMFYETISISIKKNKNNSNSTDGFIYYVNKKNQILIWEYNIDTSNPEHVTNTKFIYEGKKGELTLPKIIENFSDRKMEEAKKLPVFEMSCGEDYPVEETLLPLFKRKLLSYIFQKYSIDNLKKIEI